MRRVLVVEDNDDIRRALAELLELEGLNPVQAAHGAEAVERLTAGVVPCAIVLDLMMPVMDGWDFLQWLRDSPHRDTPVVVLTALSFDGDADRLAREWNCTV